MEIAREEREDGVHERRQSIQQISNDCASGSDFGEGCAANGEVAVGLCGQNVEGKDEFRRAKVGQQEEVGSLAEDIILNASPWLIICLFAD